MNNVFVRYTDLPISIKGYTVTDENDDYNVYINARLSIFVQEQTKTHELEHISRNHFFRCSSALCDEQEIY